MNAATVTVTVLTMKPFGWHCALSIVAKLHTDI